MFTKNKLHGRCFDDYLKKLFRKNILKNATFDSCFDSRLMLRQLTDLTFKWRELIKRMPCTCCRGDISVWILWTVLYHPTDVHSEPSQASKIDLFARIVNSFKSTFYFFCKFHRKCLKGFWIRLSPTLTLTIN